MTKKETASQKYLTWLDEEPRLVLQNNDGSVYVPISVVQEDLFSGYSGNTKMELIQQNVHSEGLSGIGRLHYKHPITGEWLFQDGSASLPYKSGMRLDFPALSAHIMLSCAKKIGRRFGRELNREIDDAPFDGHEQKPSKNGKGKREALFPEPDATIQAQYNRAVEYSNQGLMGLIRATYPNILYTGAETS